MKVREAIEQLQEHDPEAELHYCEHNGGHYMEDSTREVDEIRTGTATYGILLPPEKQRTVNTVVFDVTGCGL